MTIFAPLSISFILALKGYWGRYKKLFFYLFPFTALITIVGTASRGAQLGILAVGVWFLLKSRRGIRAMAGILILGSVLYSILPEKMLEEYGTAGDDETSEDRLVLWEFGLEVVGEHPVFGVGLENWLGYCWHMKPNGLGRRTICHETHNSYVEALTEVGITGFMVLLLNLIIIFVLNARTRANARKLDNRFIWYMAHGLDGGLVGCIVSSFFFSILSYPMYWMQLAMTVALYEISKKQLENAKESI